MKYRLAIALPAALLFVAVLALFWPSTSFSLLQYDDDIFIVHNPIVFNGWSWNSLLGSFSSLHADRHMYTPLLWVSYLFDNLLFGASALRPWGFHFTNVLLHASNALFLFFVLRLATRRTFPALLAAALWAVHPLRIESVAWVTERKDTLSTFFALVSVLCYLQAHVPSGGAEVPPPPSNCLSSSGACHCRKGFLGLALVAFMAGLLSKPMLVTLPFFFLLLDFWPLRRLSLDAPCRGLLRPVVEKAPFFALSLAFSVLTRILQSGAVGELPLRTRLACIPADYFFYLSKTLFPVNLSPMVFGLPVAPSAVPWIALLLLLLAFSVWCGRSRFPGVTVGLLAFVGLLFPVSGIVPIGSSLVADRYSYLPSVGLALAFADILCLWPRSTAWRWRILSVLALATLAPCVAATARLLPVWKNTDAFYARIAAVFPRHFAVTNREFYHAAFTEGDFAKADVFADSLLATRPHNAYSILNKTLCLSQLDSSEAALAFLESSPISEAYGTLKDVVEMQYAILLVETGNPARAIPHLGKYLEYALFEPKTAEQVHALAMWIYSVAGMDGPALEHARCIPSLADVTVLESWHFFLSHTTVWHMGFRRQALPRLLALADAESANAALLTNIAWLLAATPGSPCPPDEAIRIASKALAIDSRHPVLQDTLAVTLAFAGRFGEAVAIEQDVAAFLRDSSARDAPSMLAHVEKRLDLFRQSKPYVENASTIILHAP